MPAIRDATVTDLALLRNLDAEFKAIGTPFWSLVNEDAMKTKVETGMLIVAQEDHKLIGYLMWTLFWGRPFIEFIRLLPEHRNKGIGTKMLDALAERAIGRGYTMIWSSTDNADALRWHERNGFTRVGEATWIWGPTKETWLMKELQQARAKPRKRPSPKDQAPGIRRPQSGGPHASKASRPSPD